ncbi:hypothetical protein CARUB_v10003784mg [Capsella rubella]|uniref:Poly(A) RNA polymerase mitochondrial-like central palm domain-containing protein n=1 Tax=Capsella rubella TaxID=81985 RepID=R0FM15_9BRAS|nr:hypothetical protein CARUB_v10003784mg [Capsella rubella]
MRNPFLDPTLQEILQVTKPIQADFDTRIRVINQLCSVLQPLECFRGATVQPFGSSMSILFTQWGDLDISVDLFNGSSVLANGDSCSFYSLFFGLNFTSMVSPSSSSSMVQTAISCDISIDNLEGLLKSRFLLWISEIYGIPRPDLCACNLRVIYPKSAADDLTGLRKNAEESKLDTAKSPNPSSLSELLVSFSAKVIDFSYFSDINVKHKSSMFAPRWENISSNTRCLPKTYSLFVSLFICLSLTLLLSYIRHYDTM